MAPRLHHAEKQHMEDFRYRLTIFGVALVTMMYVVVYQTNLILIAVAKLRHH
jgi:hypothetical protein